MGAEALTMFLIVGTEDGAEFADNVYEHFAHHRASERDRPAGDRGVGAVGHLPMDDQRNAELLALAARMAAELGAARSRPPMATGDTESMRQVVAGCLGCRCWCWAAARRYAGAGAEGDADALAAAHAVRCMAATSGRRMTRSRCAACCGA